MITITVETQIKSTVTPGVTQLMVLAGSFVTPPLVVSIFVTPALVASLFVTPPLVASLFVTPLPVVGIFWHLDSLFADSIIVTFCAGEIEA